MPWSYLIPRPGQPFLRDIAFVGTCLQALTFGP
jgi:hypothetical protein